eukprot:5164332-Pleurochrysis_carterae.AAC.2
MRVMARDVLRSSAAGVRTWRRAVGRVGWRLALHRGPPDARRRGRRARDAAAQGRRARGARAHTGRHATAACIEDRPRAMAVHCSASPACAPFYFTRLACLVLTLQSRGGKVDVSEDPVRVWYGGYGLAMSRSIGDGHFKRAGVICEPDVEHLHLSPAKRGGDGEICLVLASDGIWDVLSSLEVCTAANDYSSALSACDALVTKAQQRWAREEETYRDDTTAIVVYLPFLPNPKNIKRGQSVSPAAPSTVARTETVPRKMMLPPEPVQAAMRPRPRKREDALVRKAGWCRCMPWS